MSDIFDMSDALDGLTQPTTYKQITTTTVDFVPVETVTEITIDAVVQPAKLADLQVEQIDYSKQYLQVHSTSPLTINDFIVWRGKDHKIIQLGPYQDYGFYEGVAEEWTP